MTLILIGCLTDSGETADTGQSLDQLITEIAVQTVALLPRETGANLAVYYFTVDGRKSPLSDHLINGLTTEMANLVPQGYQVLSRHGLDRIMEEHSFQLTDLVSEETRVDLGQMLGADVIITGFITPLRGVDKINVQIIQVLTGAVMGGFTLDYRPEEYSGDGGRGEILRVEKIYPEARGLAAVTTIYEDFNGPVAETVPVYFKDFWGDRVSEVAARADIDPDGYAFLDFSADLLPLSDLDEWGDTDVTWYMDFPLDRSPGGFDGFSLRIWSGGFTRLYLVAKQQTGQDLTLFAGTVTVNQEEWTSLAVPFDTLGFREGEMQLDPDQPLIIGLGIPYLENHGQFHFRNGVGGRLLVDDLGLFRLNEPADPAQVAAFEDEVTRVLVAAKIEGSGLYVDYSETDLGIIRENRGVAAQGLRVSREDDGPSGGYLRLSGHLDVTPEITSFFARNQEMSLVMDLTAPAVLAGWKDLSFTVRSDLARQGYFQVTAPSEGLQGETDFTVTQGWRRVRIPLAGSLMDTDHRPEGPEPVTFRFIWILPEENLRQAQGNRLDFTVDVDEIWLGK